MKLTIKQEDMIDLIDVCWSSFFCELESWRGSVIFSNCVDTTHAPILDDDLRRTAARPHFQAWVTRKKVAWVWNCETVAFFKNIKCLKYLSNCTEYTVQCTVVTFIYWDHISILKSTPSLQWFSPNCYLNSSKKFQNIDHNTEIIIDIGK